MNYNFYNFNFENNKLFQEKTIPYVNIISNIFEIFKEEVVKCYFKKQLGRKGIKSLGNEIRYNKNLEEKVFCIHQDFTLIKLTGNRKDFLKDFIKEVDNNKISKDLIFVVYEKEFRSISSLVDATSTKISDIISDLNLLFSSFTFKKLGFQIFFLEIFEIKGYYFIKDSEGFTKIYKI